MEITRDIILDLLPLYLADEVSADTRALVEGYLETDPQLANIARRSRLPEEIPVPLTREDQMAAYEEARRLMFRRTAIWAVLIAFAFLACMGLVVLAVFFMVPS